MSFDGPFPDSRDLVPVELAAYRAELAELDAADRAVVTRCAPWTVDDVTAHLAATFRRFADLLEQSRRGDLTPPFAPDELAARNQADVDAATGDPEPALVAEADRFLALVGDGPLDERMAHQFGPVPVGLQLLFGLHDLAVHHDDVAATRGGAYRPAPPTVDALVAMYAAFRGLPDPEPGEDDWSRVLRGSGR